MDKLKFYSDPFADSPSLLNVVLSKDSILALRYGFYSVYLDSRLQLYTEQGDIIYAKYCTVSKPFPRHMLIDREWFDRGSPDKVPRFIYIKDSNERVFKKCRMDTPLRVSIAVLWRVHHMRHKISCFDFVNMYIYARKRLEPCKFYKKTVKEVCKGDVVVLDGFKNIKTAGHAAVCIDTEYKLFLSVYGLGGDLFISDFKDFKISGWGTKGVSVFGFI